MAKINEILWDRLPIELQRKVSTFLSILQLNSSKFCCRIFLEEFQRRQKDCKTIRCLKYEDELSIESIDKHVNGWFAWIVHRCGTRTKRKIHKTEEGSYILPRLSLNIVQRNAETKIAVFAYRKHFGNVVLE